MLLSLVQRNRQLLSTLVKNVKYSSNAFINKENQIQIGDQNINYLKVGKGNHALLCFPGALGTIWSDFTPQIEGLNHDKFTIVAWDPPGYGKSRPPKRSFSTDFYNKDADMAFAFMKEIGINNFSLLGWSDGGISSMILAAKYPTAVKKLIMWGANSYVLPEEIVGYERIRDIERWSNRMKAPLIKLYTQEGLQEMWNSWIDALTEMHKQGGDICKKELAAIKCPTLILHGNLDPMVASEHPNYLLKNIKGAKIHNFPEGKHNIHLRYPDQFNAIITNFLEEK